MPQNQSVISLSKTPSGTYTPDNQDSAGNVKTTNNQATSATYNITAATVVKATPGKIAKISVIVAGSAAGSANNCITTGAAAVGNQVAAIPAAVGVIDVNWPCSAGITIVPGTGQTIAVSYS